MRCSNPLTDATIAGRIALLRERCEPARAILAGCTLCPHNCRVNRLEGERGRCRTGAQTIVSSAGPHFGEEPPLVIGGGSGTIFFANCNLACIFCQNYDISHWGTGRAVDARQLGEAMLWLQEYGCVNVNFVTPTHVVPQIMDALRIAYESGLRLPTVYNCGGYESVDALRLLDGIIDIYMPDAKYSDPAIAHELSGAPAPGEGIDYVTACRAALKEMHRQVGDLELDEYGRALRGLLVRHLVLPAGLAGTADLARFLAEEVSRDTYVNVMDQYRPCHEARRREELRRRITSREFDEAVDAFRRAGIARFAD
jgi:putative pyruvate formate lyase activating enzyme